MRGERGLVEVAFRPRLVIEVTVAVDPAHEGRRVANLQLRNVRRDVANGQADAAVILNADAMDRRNLYVAMTRGSRTLTVCSRNQFLNP